MAKDNVIAFGRTRAPRPARPRGPRPSPAQRAYLERGLAQPGGKLPLFDLEGQRYSERTIRRCIDQGWAEPWFDNPVKPDWLVCRLTEAGRDCLSRPAEPAEAAEVVPLPLLREVKKAS